MITPIIRKYNGNQQTETMLIEYHNKLRSEQERKISNKKVPKLVTKKGK